MPILADAALQEDAIASGWRDETDVVVIGSGGVHGSNRLGGNAGSDIVTFGRLAGAGVAAYAR